MEIPGLDPVREHFNLFPGTRESCIELLKWDLVSTLECLWHQFLTFQGWVIAWDSSRRGTWGLLCGLKLPNTLGIKVSLLFPNYNIKRFPGKALPQWPLPRASPSSRSSQRTSERRRYASPAGWTWAGVCGSISTRPPKCLSSQCMDSSQSNWRLTWGSPSTQPQVLAKFLVIPQTTDQLRHDGRGDGKSDIKCSSRYDWSASATAWQRQKGAFILR